MINIKHKGVSLIEMLVAMAIFAIASSVIVLTIDSSAKIYKKENVKFPTYSAANSLVQQLKAKGIGEKTASIPGEAVQPINNVEDMYSIDNDASIAKKIYIIYFNYGDLKDVLKDTEYINAADNVNSDFDSVINFNKQKASSKKYAAYITLKKAVDNSRKIDNENGEINVNTEWLYNVYTAEVKVWDMSAGDSSMSSASTSVSR